MTVNLPTVVALTLSVLLCTSSFAQSDAKKDAAQPSKEEMMKKYDTDGDGKLSQEERAAVQKDMGGAKAAPAAAGAAGKADGNAKQAEMMKKYDTDGDGKMSEEEIAAAKASMGGNSAAAKEGSGSKPAAAGNAADGEAKRAEMMKKYDTDGDGKMSPEEIEAAKKAMSDE